MTGTTSNGRWIALRQLGYGNDAIWCITDRSDHRPCAGDMSREMAERICAALNTTSDAEPVAWADPVALAENTCGTWCRKPTEVFPASTQPLYAASQPAGWSTIGRPDSVRFGQEALFWKSEWVDPDFNPKGTQVGYFQEGEPGEECFVVARYCSTHESYETDYLIDPADWPTHWCAIPTSPGGAPQPTTDDAMGCHAASEGV